MNEIDDSEACPEWGSLPLDQYMLARWDDGSKISTDQQQLQLARSYVATGSTDRAEYAEQARHGHINPTKDQISRILRPFRAPALRRTAERLLNHRGVFIWLRTDYNHDEQRQALIRTLTSSDLYDFWAKYLSEGSLVLSDARFFNLGAQWEGILDLLPEIVDCKIHELPDGYRSDIRFYRERVKRSYMEWDRSYYDEGEPDDELFRIIESESTSESPISREEAEARLFKTRVVDCHALACETILLVEDAETYATDPVTLKVLWLDDRAAVIRHARATAEEVDEFLVRVDLCWEDTCFLYADVGPEYARGGRYGPPYTIAY